MKKKHPKGTYEVVGAVGTGLVNPAGQYGYGTDSSFYYQPKQSGLRYRTVGYIEVGDGQYFAVMKKTMRLPILLLAVLLLVLISVLTAFLFIKETGGLIDSGAVDYTPPEGLVAEGSENSIAIPGYSYVYVEAGTDVAYVALWNPAGNPCYFKYIFTTEDGEKLYESGLIPPGKAVTEVQLSKKIPSGEQKLLIEVKTYSLSDQETPLNGGLVESRLIGIEP